MKKEYANTIGGRIKRLCRVNGVTYQALAEMIGYTPYTVGLILNDRTSVRADTIGLIAEEFGVSTDYLIYGQDSTAGTMEKLACLCRDMESALEAVGRKK